jgi:hypothetical protein
MHRELPSRRQQNFLSVGVAAAITHYLAEKRHLDSLVEEDEEPETTKSQEDEDDETEDADEEASVFEARTNDECLLSELIYQQLRLAGRESDLYPHGRKILRNQRTTFECWDDSLRLEHYGYTDKKLTDLERLYFDEESHASALRLWQSRKPGKMKSVAFHTFAHLTKRAGVNGEQGPCLNSVTVTALPNGQVAVNVAYRSVDLFKKFAADLVFPPDVLLKDFGRIDSVTCNIANATVHPLYFSILFPHLADPVTDLRDLEEIDDHFWVAVTRETEDLFCGGTANANFASAQRLKRFVLKRTDSKIMKAVIAYVKAGK